MRNYCTSVDEDFIVRLLAMHESMERHCQPYRLWVLALRPVALAIMGQLALPNVALVPMEEVETEALKAVRPMREWREYVWTIKSSWMLYLLDCRELDSVCYVDSDGYFFADPSSLFDEIGNAPLAITPHRFSRKLRHYVKFGRFNAGFIYVEREGRACIEHWSKQCLDCCSSHEGRYVDQGYLDEWSKRWGACEIQHKGVNLAPWSQRQYGYTLCEGEIYVDGDPLVWYHFHGGLKWYKYKKKQYKLHPFVREYIYKPYIMALRRHKNDTTTT